MCMCVCAPCACQCLQRPEEGIRSGGAGVTDDCKLLSKYEESSLGHLKECPVLLTTEKFLQSHA